MGRTYLLPYRLEMDGGDFGASIGWDYMKGRPTAEGIESFLVGLAKSTEPGGPNDHLRVILNGVAILPRLPRAARLIAQKGPNAGKIVAEWNHPPFFAY